MEKSEILKKVGKRIKVKKGISQTDLIGRIEVCRTNPTIFTSFRISEELKIPLDHLVN